MKQGINIYNSIEEVVKAFSTMIKDLIGKISDENNFSIALSGGNTPGILFDYLAKNNRENINWEKVSFYWGDERCVPSDHPKSNYGMAYQHLIKHIDIPKKSRKI